MNVMRITLELPDNTVSIKYCVDDGGSYPSDDKPVTLGMIVDVNTPPIKQMGFLNTLGTITNRTEGNQTPSTTSVRL